MISQDVQTHSVIYHARMQEPRPDGQAVEVLAYVVTKKEANGVYSKLCSMLDGRHDEWVDIYDTTPLSNECLRLRFVSFEHSHFFDTPKAAVKHLVEQKMMGVRILEKNLERIKNDADQLSNGKLFLKKGNQ